MAIKNFRHKGLEDYFYDGTTRGINTAHTKKLDTRLDRLDASTCPEDMKLPGYRFHQLKPKKRWTLGNRSIRGLVPYI